VRVGTEDVTGPAEADGEQPPPGDDGVQRSWAIRWAVRRKAAKAGRNFAEADRIRALLKGAGWEVRDNRDGSIEVVRAGNR
jgi:cysteinyl-tRNA synthetase